MNGLSRKSSSADSEKILTNEEQQAKINEVKTLVGVQLPEKLSVYCSDAAVARYLRARNWHVKKSAKMLKDSLKWRASYKPEDIRWGDIATEAETGKIYRSDYVDKHGRTVLIMRPSKQNSKSTRGQIKYLVYCMENAIMNLPREQEQMVWLIDFEGFNLSHISVKVTRETAHVLQDHYPERLGLAILYNPPKFFEPFWTVVKPFLEPKTVKKVQFVYSDDPNSKKLMEDLFDMDKLESAFGGRDTSGFDIGKYAERMKEDDKKIPSLWTRDHLDALISDTVPVPDVIAALDSITLESESDSSENEKTENPTLSETESGDIEDMVEAKGENPSGDVHKEY